MLKLTNDIVHRIELFTGAVCTVPVDQCSEFPPDVLLTSSDATHYTVACTHTCLWNMHRPVSRNQELN